VLKHIHDNKNAETELLFRQLQCKNIRGGSTVKNTTAMVTSRNRFLQ